jgi:hypothetical protein
MTKVNMPVTTPIAPTSSFRRRAHAADAEATAAGALAGAFVFHQLTTNRRGHRHRSRHRHGDVGGIGWIIAGIGAAISVGGIVLVARAPEKSNTVSLASWVTAESGGVVVRGAW